MQSTRKFVSNLRNQVTRFASSASSHQGIRQKSTKDIWLGDSGAYPIMGAIGFCFCYFSFHGIRYLATSPDVKLAKSKSDFFRGDAVH